MSSTVYGSTFEAGNLVTVRGLVNRHELNRCTGIVLPQSMWLASKIAVILDTKPPKLFHLKEDNLVAFENTQPGDDQPPPQPDGESFAYFGSPFDVLATDVSLSTLTRLPSWKRAFVIH